jgi:hypothetical protein
MRSSRLGVALLLVVAQLLGCAIFASKAELELVNRLRDESDPLVRTEALRDYDTRYGEGGRLGDRVAPLRADIDEGYWQHVVNTDQQETEVQAYLQSFPEGAHATEAQRRLDQLRYFAARDAELREQQAQAEEAERQRIDEERERQVALVRSGFERLLVAALTMPRWGTTIEALAALHPPFRELWQGEPRPECTADTCRRTLTANYFFAQTGATRVDRNISLVVQVDTRGGRVYQITGYYTGRGFIDWLEITSEQVIPEASDEEREMARDAILGVFQGTIDSNLTGASEVETDEEGVLARFRHEDLIVTLQEFPPTFAAGRVDGFRVTFEGDITPPPAPTPDE